MSLPSSAPIDAQGSALSVDRLAHQYHGVLMRFLTRRLKSCADAADVAQEAYIRMLQYEGSRGVRSPYAMLLRIAINVAQDMGRAGRARRVQLHTSIDGLEIASRAPTPEAELQAADDLDRVLAAIDRLPPRCREVFLMHRREECSYEEIARRCGISVKMVEKHISTALAACMKQVWGDGS